MTFGDGMKRPRVKISSARLIRYVTLWPVYWMIRPPPPSTLFFFSQLRADDLWMQGENRRESAQFFFAFLPSFFYNTFDCVCILSESFGFYILIDAYRGRLRNRKRVKLIFLSKGRGKGEKLIYFLVLNDFYYCGSRRFKVLSSYQILN